MSNEANPNAGNQYDAPNHDVVVADPPETPDEPETEEPEPEPEEEPAPE